LSAYKWLTVEGCGNDTFLYYHDLILDVLNSVKKDALVSFLCEKCSLTQTQLDTILLSELDEELKTKASLRDRHKVSEGAFVRSLRQGQENIEASMYTLILLNYLGFVGENDFQKLSRISGLISKVKESSPDPEAIERLIVALQEFVEGFSHRRKLIV